MVAVSYQIRGGGGANATGSGTNGENLTGTYELTATGTFPVVVGGGGQAESTLFANASIYMPGDGQSLFYGARGSYGLASLPAIAGFATPFDLGDGRANTSAPAIYQIGVTTASNTSPATARTYDKFDLIYAKIGESTSASGPMVDRVLGNIDTSVRPWTELSVESGFGNSGGYVGDQEGGVSSQFGIALAIAGDGLFAGADEVLFGKVASDGTSSAAHTMLGGGAQAQNRRMMWRNFMREYVRAKLAAGKTVLAGWQSTQQGEAGATDLRNFDSASWRAAQTPPKTTTDRDNNYITQANWQADWASNQDVFEEVFGCRLITFVHDLVVMDGYTDTATRPGEQMTEQGSDRNTTGFSHPDPHTKWMRDKQEKACRYTVQVRWTGSGTMANALAATDLSGIIGTVTDNGTAGGQRGDWHWLKADWPTRSGQAFDPHIHAACNRIRGQAEVARYRQIVGNAEGSAAYQISRVAPYRMIPGAASNVTAGSADITVQASWACQLKVLALPFTDPEPTAAAILAHASTKTFTVGENVLETKTVTDLPSGSDLKLWRVFHDVDPNGARNIHFTGPVQPALAITTAAAETAKFNLTFQPEDTSATNGIAYSNGDRTVLRVGTALSGNRGFKALGQKSGGKWFSVVKVRGGQANSWGLHSTALTTTGGGTSNRFAILSSGQLARPGIDPGTGSAYTNATGMGVPNLNSILIFAEDLTVPDEEKAWAYGPAGVWNGSAGGDPTANPPTGGHPIKTTMDVGGAVVLGGIMGSGTNNAGFQLLTPADSADWPTAIAAALEARGFVLRTTA